MLGMYRLECLRFHHSSAKFDCSVAHICCYIVLLGHQKSSNLESGVGQFSHFNANIRFIQDSLRLKKVVGCPRN